MFQAIPHPWSACAGHGLHVAAVGRTHVGMVRNTNEDCFALLPHLELFLLTDGMGAARLPRRSSSTTCARRSMIPTRRGQWGSRSRPPEVGMLLLIGGVQRANHVIANGQRARRGLEDGDGHHHHDRARALRRPRRGTAVRSQSTAAQARRQISPRSTYPEATQRRGRRERACKRGHRL